MQRLAPRATGTGRGLTWATVFVLWGCARFSETIVDPNAGMNGSFETTKAGLPVNWLVYTAKTVPAGDFDVIVDTVQFKDGKQSMKFVVRQSSATGGRLAPGLSQMFKASPGETYRVSFWARNEGSEFLARVGGVSGTAGAYDTIAKSKETMAEWRRFEHSYTIPRQMNALRFEINVLQPGSFWIDDVRIEAVASMPAG